MGRFVAVWVAVAPSPTQSGVAGAAGGWNQICQAVSQRQVRIARAHEKLFSILFGYVVCILLGRFLFGIFLSPIWLLKTMPRRARPDLGYRRRRELLLPVSVAQMDSCTLWLTLLRDSLLL